MQRHLIEALAKYGKRSGLDPQLVDILEQYTNMYKTVYTLKEYASDRIGGIPRTNSRSSKKNKEFQSIASGRWFICIVRIQRKKSADKRVEIQQRTTPKNKSIQNRS